MARNKIKYRNTIYDRLSSGGVHLAMSFLPDALEANTLSVAVETENKEILDFLLDDPVTYYYRKKQIGIFYLQSVQQITENKYELYATSAIGLLMKRIHRGGIYTGQTVKEILPDIFGPIPYSVKSNLLDIKLYGWLPYVKPPDSSARDNLVQILFAIGASVKTDLNGTVRIEPLWDGVSSFEGTDRMGQGASVTRDAKVTSVSVTEHQYTVGTESVDLFEGTVQEGDIITFDEPMHSLEATGFSILSSGANYATLSAGSGKLTGKNYIHNTRIIEKKISESQTENIESVEDKTLVSLVNSNAVAERLANYHKCFEFIDAKIVYKDEIPGDVINVYHPYDKEIVTACLESADINLSNTLKADETLLVGFVPPKPEVGYINERVVLTGSGRWKKPDGVKSVTYVLIGGAQGGRAGKQGGSAEAGRSYGFTNKPFDETYSYRGLYPGLGGEGGEGGGPGHGGKIYRGDLNVSNVDGLDYSCGPGGLGAAYNAEQPDTEGAEGGATTLGDISSELGSVSDTGYVDTITGETYGASGKSGIAGGDGAGASQAPSSLEDFGLYIIPAGSVTDEDGVVWNGGATNMQPDDPDKIEGESKTAALTDGSAGAEASVPLGSGAAAGSNGINGGSTPGQHSAVKDSGGTKITARARQAAGRNGADATLIPKKAINGCGGRGGYGGGGASAAGVAQVYSGGTGSFDVAVNAGTEGVGGAGSQGGQGSDGLIILYYSVPVVANSGPLVTKTPRWFNDRYGRRFIV